MQNGEQDFNDDDRLLGDFDTGFYQDEFEAVKPTDEEMILGPTYITYAGEPVMDAGALNAQIGMWLPKAQVEITSLTFDGQYPLPNFG